MRSLGRPWGLWSEMMGLRQDGLEVFLLMESIRCKCLLHPVLMGSFHWEGTMTLLCFDTPLLSPAALAACKWQPPQTSWLPSFTVSGMNLSIGECSCGKCGWNVRFDFSGFAEEASECVSDSISQVLSALQGASWGNSTLAAPLLLPQALALLRHPSFTPDRCALHSGLLHLSRYALRSRWSPAVWASAWSITH